MSRHIKWANWVTKLYTDDTSIPLSDGIDEDFVEDDLITEDIIVDTTAPVLPTPCTHGAPTKTMSTPTLPIPLRTPRSAASQAGRKKRNALDATLPTTAARVVDFGFETRDTTLNFCSMLD